MTLILLYLVVLILIGIVLFGVASLVFGRGEELPPLPRGTTATVLPASGVTGADVEAVKFTQVLRGYKTSEERIGQVMAKRRKEVFLATKVEDRTSDGAMKQLRARLYEFELEKKRVESRKSGRWMNHAG